MRVLATATEMTCSPTPLPRPTLYYIHTYTCMALRTHIYVCMYVLYCNRERPPCARFLPPPLVFFVSLAGLSPSLLAASSFARPQLFSFSLSFARSLSHTHTYRLSALTLFCPSCLTPSFSLSLSSLIPVSLPRSLSHSLLYNGQERNNHHRRQRL